MSSSHRNKRYLVTGGTGFLGWHLIKYLISCDARIRVFSRNISPEIKSLGKNVEHFKGTILDKASIEAACEGVDGIFHLAGLVLHSRNISTEEVYKVNVDGTLNVMEAANIFKCKVVLASTSGTVGCSENRNFIAKDDYPYCRDIAKDWPYYDSKIECEIKALEFSHEHDVPLVIIRPSSMYGPEDFYGRSTGTIKSFLERRIPFTPPGGISYLDIRDAAKAFATAMVKGKNGETYLLGSKNCSISEFFDDLEKISNVKKPSIMLPGIIMKKATYLIDLYKRKVKGKWDPSVDPVKAEMATHWWNVDWEKATNDLDFQPIDPYKTLEDTVHWLQEQSEDNLKSKL